MRIDPKVDETAREILHAFEAGTVPKALAQVFLRTGDEYPSAAWSFRNRFLCALRGHFDTRGYRQWQEVGRQVKRGERALRILCPRLKCVGTQTPAETETPEQPEPLYAVTGYLTLPVFGYLQTEGEPLPGSEKEAAFIDTLPLIEVVRAWKLDIATFNAAQATALGSYAPGLGISLGVENLATWAHELVHAADDRLGSITKKPGQQLDNEVVAELGGAVLLECLGYALESDRGGAWRYIGSYAEEHEQQPLGVCLQLLDRTCACVSHLLDTARQLTAAPAAASAG